MSKPLIRHASVNSKTSLKVFGSWPAFVSLQLASCEMVNHNTKRLRFKLPNEDATSGLPLTCINLPICGTLSPPTKLRPAVLTISWPNGRWLPVARPYTPISALDQPGFLELLVKRYPRGKQSTHLHSSEPGQSLVFAAPLQGYPWKLNSFPHFTMLAGGLGITPIYQLARGILSNPEDKTAITLLFAANTEQDLVLKDELDRLRSEFASRLTITYIVSHSAIDSKPLFQKGRVTRDLLHKVAPRPKDQDTKVFICGPPAMESALIGTNDKTGILQELGYVKDQVHKF